jgi:hypothetical protein
MELSSSCEATSHSAIQEILNILWNPNIYCRVHTNPPLVLVLSQMNPVYTTSHLRLGIPSVSPPPNRILYAFHLSPIIMKKIVVRDATAWDYTNVRQADSLLYRYIDIGLLS